MDNQLIQSPFWTRRLLLIVFSLVLMVTIGILGIYWNQNSNPYIQEVLSLQGDIIQGGNIFQINCAGCHGIEANGIVGPSLKSIAKRKSKTELINQVISGSTPPMPKFQPNSQEMADLLSYLEHIQ